MEKSDNFRPEYRSETRSLRRNCVAIYSGYIFLSIFHQGNFDFKILENGISIDVYWFNCIVFIVATYQFVHYCVSAWSDISISKIPDYWKFMKNVDRKIESLPAISATDEQMNSVLSSIDRVIQSSKDISWNKQDISSLKPIFEEIRNNLNIYGEIIIQKPVDPLKMDRLSIDSEFKAVRDVAERMRSIPDRLEGFVNNLNMEKANFQIQMNSISERLVKLERIHSDYRSIKISVGDSLNFIRNRPAPLLIELLLFDFLAPILLFMISAAMFMLYVFFGYSILQIGADGHFNWIATASKS